MDKNLTTVAVALSAAALAACGTTSNADSNFNSSSHPSPSSSNWRQDYDRAAQEAAQLQNDPHVQQVLSRYAGYVELNDIARNGGQMITQAGTDKAMCTVGPSSDVVETCEELAKQRGRHVGPAAPAARHVPSSISSTPAPSGQAAPPPPPARGFSNAPMNDTARLKWNRTEKQCLGTTIKWDFDKDNNTAYGTVTGNGHRAFVTYDFTKRTVTPNHNMNQADDHVTIQGTNVYANGALVGPIPPRSVFTTCAAPKAQPAAPGYGSAG